jgi:Astacin (Peptidase family M12A)
MAKSKAKPANAAMAPADVAGMGYCAVPRVAALPMPDNVDPLRASILLALSKRWANGTVLKYYFFDRSSDGGFVMLSDGTRDWRPWTANSAQLDVVRNAFKIWKGLGLGLEFKEVAARSDAQVRIGFMQGDGSWSYIGRDILGQGPGQRTMNFGWDLTQPKGKDTALHEIGHTIGFPHEHQNPKSGIVWNEPAVYADLAGKPNFWKQEKTFDNIIRKLDPNDVDGSEWDKDSVMHYPFKHGLILKPEIYQTQDLIPKGGLSDRDIALAKKWYPGEALAEAELKPFQAVQLKLGIGEQANFAIQPAETRTYDIQTFGECDTLMLLYEQDDGDLHQLSADDDSGQDKNAAFNVKLIKDRKYVLRVRMNYTDRPGECGVMLW